MDVRRGQRGLPGHRTGLPVAGPGWRARGRGVVLAVVLGLALSQSPATAQDGGDGPYGSTTTTAGQGPNPSCRLSQSTASPGGTATARVHAAPRGSSVEIRFDGATVAEQTATGPGSSPQVNVDIRFTVPSDAEEGSHTVTAVGAEFTASCGTLETSGEVLSANEERGNGGSLPKTGVYIALLLVVGFVLVLIGRVLLAASRRTASDGHGSYPSRPRTPSGR